MTTDGTIAQAYSDLSSTCGSLKEDYFGLLYLEEEHSLARDRVLNQAAFGGNDYAVDGFHFDKPCKISIPTSSSIPPPSIFRALSWVSCFPSPRPR